jgi:uncharacterized protein (TIGR02597 family)
MYMIVRHNVATATELVSHGTVLDTGWQSILRRQAADRQDNLLAVPRPYAVSLNDSGLIESGAFQPSPSRFDIRDRLFVFDNSTVSQNKSPAGTYYYCNGMWQKVGTGTADVGTERALVPGSGFVIRAASGSTASIWNNEPNY